MLTSDQEFETWLGAEPDEALSCNGDCRQTNLRPWQRDYGKTEHPSGLKESLASAGYPPLRVKEGVLLTCALQFNFSR